MSIGAKNRSAFTLNKDHKKLGKRKRSLHRHWNWVRSVWIYLKNPHRCGTMRERVERERERERMGFDVLSPSLSSTLLLQFPLSLSLFLMLSREREGLEQWIAGVRKRVREKCENNPILFAYCDSVPGLFSLHKVFFCIWAPNFFFFTNNLLFVNYFLYLFYKKTIYIITTMRAESPYHSTLQFYV